MKKISRKVAIKRAKTRTHQLWSLLVRRRDGRCTLCGTTETLQAHHWIVHAGSSLGTRFLLDNGVTLCYACHIFKVHGRGDAFYFDQIKVYMFGMCGVTDERYEQIKTLGRGIADFSLEDIEMIEGHLKMLWDTGDKNGLRSDGRQGGLEGIAGDQAGEAGDGGR